MALESQQPSPAAVFVWNQKYETGIGEVDAQHRVLVELINRVGSLHACGADGDEIDEVLEELAEYARTHFAMEHGLMRDSGMDPEFVRAHVGTHGEFIKQLELMRARVAVSPADLVPGLLHYLIAWLADHILVEDHAMAWQIRAIAGGMSPEAALRWVSNKASASQEALLEAMHRIYDELAARNAELAERNAQLSERERQLDQARRELASFNAGLSERVAERTAEVYEAQIRLQQEYDNQRALQRQLERARRDAMRGVLPATLVDEIGNALDRLQTHLQAMPAEVPGTLGAVQEIQRLRLLLNPVRVANAS